MTPDPEAALRCYGARFGCRPQKMAMPEGDCRVVKADDTSVSGIMKIPAQAKSAGVTPPWGGDVTVDDADATARKVGELGGRLVHGPHDIPGVGRMAVIVDPQGAMLNIITDAPTG